MVRVTVLKREGRGGEGGVQSSFQIENYNITIIDDQNCTRIGKNKIDIKIRMVVYYIVQNTHVYCQFRVIE